MNNVLEKMGEEAAVANFKVEPYHWSVGIDKTTETLLGKFVYRSRFETDTSRI
jgi:hypothetical protein